MIRSVRNTFACLAAIALCGIFTGCGEQPQQPPVEKKQTKTENTRKTDSVESTFDRTAELENYNFSSDRRSPEEPETPVEDVVSETLQPVSTTEAATQTEIRRDKRSVWKIESAIPASSIAAQVQKNTQLAPGKSFVWTPQPVKGNNLSLFRVPDIKLSTDTSLLVFLETMGEASGPFGSRLILMSTSNWKVLNILEFRNRYFKKFEFIPGTTKIAALCLEQKKAGQKQGFACFDLLTGQEERFQQIDPGIGDTTFLTDRNKNLIVSHPKRAELIVLPLENTSKQTIEVASANAIATLSPDGKQLAVLSPEHGKRIEIFRTSDWLPVSTVDLTETTNAASFHFIPGNKSFFICGNPAYSSGSTLTRAGKTTSLEGLSSGKVNFADNGKMICHLTRDDNKIDVLDNVTGTRIRTIEVNKAKPNFRKSRPGEITHCFYIPSCKGMAMFDDKGHFFLISLEPPENAKGQYHERAIIFQQSVED